jgi:predicted aldo/keto reductase-like oxidoreductase
VRGPDLDPQSADSRRKIEKALTESLHESLNALGRDCIDVLLLHSVTDAQMIEHDGIQAFFTEAKREGKIRACGFSTHANQVELMKSANASGFFDVVMVTYNHNGSFVHSRSGHSRAWNQTELEAELREAEKTRIGIVAMKTCSAGPYTDVPGAEPTFKGALDWVLKHSYIATSAVAMANFQEIEENCRAMEL